MRAHSQGFKEQIKELGKEIDSRIIYDDKILTSEELCSISSVTNGSILKSTMKVLEFESTIQVPQNSTITYEFGLKVNGEYEYLNYGNFIVYSSEYNEDTRTYNHLCYDFMLNTMKEYKNLQNGTFPMTVREYINGLCLDCGLTFKNNEEEFANYNQIIESDLYANLDYTYRDIFDELSQVTASSICVDLNDMVEVRYIIETNDEINEEYFKDINVKFGEKYGPVNSIVLSRSAESDNVYLPNEESIATNGLCEIKIIDNQIMNFNNRSDYLPAILEKLNGLEFFVNDFTSTGVLYYELCDRYTVKIGENTYSCVLFNDEQNITQGVVEDIYTEKPEESVTDYKKADKTDRRINQVYIIADKQNKKIESVVSETIDTNNSNSLINKMTKVTQDVNGLGITVSEQKTSLENLDGKILGLEGTLNDMSFNFSTKGLAVGTSTDPNNSLLDNTGIKVYNYNKLNAIFNNKGSGIDKLIVTGTAQIGYFKTVKSEKTYMLDGVSVTKKANKHFFLKELIEDLEDLM